MNFEDETEINDPESCPTPIKKLRDSEKGLSKKELRLKLAEKHKELLSWQLKNLGTPLTEKDASFYYEYFNKMKRDDYKIHLHMVKSFTR